LAERRHDAVLIVRDRSGATMDHVLPELQAPTFAAYLAPFFAATRAMRVAVFLCVPRVAGGSLGRPR
jgi:hypothetical protein